MKILRKEALALLNACFADDTNGRFMDSANQYNLHFDFVRMQLTSAIFSLYTNRIWQKFCANPIDVMDKYQGWDLLVEITTNAITEFFDNYPKLYLPLKLYMREDIGTVNNLIIDSTEIGSCKTYKKLERIIESFHKYWAMCWETTNIPKNIPENDIKIDAFIYFTALYNLYEDRLEDLYNDLRIAISEQVWTDKRMNQIIYKDNAVRHQDFNSDVDSYKFQCSLFRKIVISKVFDGYDLSDTNQVFFYKTYTSLLFPPIMSLIKDLAIISLAEYTFYLKIIHSDKNFWGTEWADDHINKNRLIPDFMT